MCSVVKPHPWQPLRTSSSPSSSLSHQHHPSPHSASTYFDAPCPSGTPPERDQTLPKHVQDLLTGLVEEQITSPTATADQPAHKDNPQALIPGLPPYRAEETYWDILNRRSQSYTHHPCGHRCVTCEESGTHRQDTSEDDEYCNKHCDGSLLGLWKVMLLVALLTAIVVLLFCLVKLGMSMVGLEL